MFSRLEVLSIASVGGDAYDASLSCAAGKIRRLGAACNGWNGPDAATLRTWDLNRNDEFRTSYHFEKGQSFILSTPDALIISEDRDWIWIYY